MTATIKGFDSFKDLYPGDPFFGSIWKDCINGQPGKYLLHDGFLFKGNQLCVPNWSLRDPWELSADVTILVYLQDSHI